LAAANFSFYKEYPSMKNVDELTAYCGLFCGDCIRYKNKYAPLARELSDALQKVKFDRYVAVKSLYDVKYKGYNEFEKFLQALIELQCNHGCRGGGCPTLKCKIMECCQNRGLEGCWECGNLESCDKFDFLKPFHGDGPLRNLEKIKDLGLENWLKQGEKFYKWL
jgi:hypothetical protein